MDAEVKRAENASQIKKIFQDLEAIIGPTLPVLPSIPVTAIDGFKKINCFLGCPLLILLTLQKPCIYN